MADLEEAELVVGQMQAAPRGLLRVTMPLNFGYLGSLVASYLERYPDVEVELVCTDRVVDLIAEAFDLAVRAGRLVDSTLISRRLGVLQSYCVASPAYLDRAGAPEAPQGLTSLDALVFGGGTARSRWQLLNDRKTVDIDVDARLVVNDFDFLVDAVLSGLGVAMLPAFRCVEHLRAGRLQRLLPRWRSPDIPIQAVYPSTRHLSPKVSAFLEHLGEGMTPPPWSVEGSRRQV